jgi:hypothetical protein
MFFTVPFFVLSAEEVFSRPDSSMFDISTEDSDVKPVRGDVVMFTYENFSPRAAPVNLKITRIRYDLSWDDVLYNELQQIQSPVLNGTTHTPPPPSPGIKSPIALFIEVYSQLLFSFCVDISSQFFGLSPKPFGFWSDRKKNRRLFFEKYAKSRNLDPLIPENWYSVSRKSVLQYKVFLLYSFSEVRI